jgi:SAM-dependent methyltransferase
MDALSPGQQRRWETVLDYVASVIPAGACRIVVGGDPDRTALLAARLASHLRGRGVSASCPEGGAAVVVEGEGPPRQIVVGARTRDPESRLDVAAAVVDMQDPGWPVLRHLDGGGEQWYLSESRAFFGVRAAGWDARFGDDLPAYESAVRDAGLAAGGVAIDIGCGTGRALPGLRAAVGAGGAVIGADHTPQMLQVARERAAACDARLLLADARRVPVADGSVDAVFAAGLINHLPDAGAGLAEFARITRPGGRLVLFHPTGRAALAARHGRRLRADEPLAEAVLRPSAGDAGWELVAYEDGETRFHAVAVRRM